MSAITQTDVDNLKKALVSGELQVRIADRWITYRSVEELKSALDWAKGEVAASDTSGGASRRATAYVVSVDRGVS